LTALLLVLVVVFVLEIPQRIEEENEDEPGRAPIRG